MPSATSLGKLPSLGIFAAMPYRNRESRQERYLREIRDDARERDRIRRARDDQREIDRWIARGGVLPPAPPAKPFWRWLIISWLVGVVVLSGLWLAASWWVSDQERQQALPITIHSPPLHPPAALKLACRNADTKRPCANGVVNTYCNNKILLDISNMTYASSVALMASSRYSILVYDPVATPRDVASPQQFGGEPMPDGTAAYYADIPAETKSASWTVTAELLSPTGKVIAVGHLHLTLRFQLGTCPAG